MNIVEILDQIEQSGQTDIPAVLAAIPADHDFWTGMLAILRPRPYAYRVRFVDPPIFSTHPVAQGVCAKILHILYRGNLSEDNLLRACSAFSRSCQPNEWTRWYGPLFNRTLVPPVQSELFWMACPVHLIKQSEQLPPFRSQDDCPDRMLIEPWVEAERLTWMVTSTVICSDPQIDHLYPEIGQALQPYVGEQFEAYCDGSVILFRDCYRNPTETLEIRHQRLQRIETQLPSTASLIQSAEWTGDRAIIEMIREQGYKGFVVRGLDQTYWEGSSLIVPFSGSSHLSRFGL